MSEIKGEDASRMTVGQLLVRLLPDLPPIPIDEVRMTLGDLTAVVEWDRVMEIDQDGIPVLADDAVSVKTVERPGCISISVAMSAVTP